MSTLSAKIVIPALMLLGLPLCGILVGGLPLSRFLEFPPRTLYVDHAPFYWPVFCAYALFILGVLSPFLVRGIQGRGSTEKTRAVLRPFPWWGWLGVLFGAAGLPPRAAQHFPTERVVGLPVGFVRWRAHRHDGRATSRL